MEDLSDVYNELIMEHSMNSYNKKKIENANFCEIGHNPNCGDEITLQLKIDGDKISVTVESKKHDAALANQIMRRIQEEFEDNKYITVTFRK